MYLAEIIITALEYIMLGRIYLISLSFKNEYNIFIGLIEKFFICYLFLLIQIRAA